MIHIFGHKVPDTDSICAAIAYSYLKSELGQEAEAYRLGELNKETKLVLERFNMDVPPLLDSAADKDVILVDHNEFEQSADDIEKANILEVVDHHKVKFSWDRPIYMLVMPVGSTSTIIASKFFWKDVRIPQEIAGILLSAILSDTVIFKSPTTTEKDREMAEKLAELAGIDDMVSWGMEMFRAKSAIAEKSAKELVYNDYKVYDFNGKKVLIDQIEVVDDREALERKEELLEEMKKVKEQEGFFGVLVLITDIMKEGSTMLVVADDLEPFEKAFNVKLEDNQAWLAGVMSRKKQVVPPLEKIFSN